MIFNYLNTAFRFLRKNWALTTLNVVAYGIGLAACTLILHNIIYETSYDKFNVNHENIYRVSLDHYFPYDAYQNSTAISFYPLGDELKNQYAEIQEFTKVSRKIQNTEVRVGDNVFREDNVYVVDSSFFKIFSIDMISGASGNFTLYDIFLSESLASKLFEEKNPIGNTVEFWGRAYSVKGVYEDVPENSHFKHDLLFVVFNDENQMDNWQHYNYYTYIMLKAGVDEKGFEQKLKPFSDNFSKFSDEQSNVDYRWEIKLQPLTSIYLQSDIDFEHEVNGDAQNVYILLVVAFLIVIISCFNYVNLSNSMYAKRFLEFFIRKVHGATSANLLKQYTIESLSLNLLGLAAGVIILFLIPLFTEYSINLLGQPSAFYWGIFGIIAASFTLSIVLPALAFSMVDPLKYMKGEYVTNALAKGFGRSLIVTQFVVSFILIAGAVTINKQLSFIVKKNPGINTSNVITVDFPGVFYPNREGDFGKMKVDLEKNVSIQNVAFSEIVPGTKYTRDGSIRFIEDPAENAILNYLQLVSSDYFETYEIEVLAGRIFDGQRPADSLAILVNESTAKEFDVKNYADLLGREVTMPWNGGHPTFEIVGVVKDYYHESLKNNIHPCAFVRIGSGGYCYKASIRVNNSSEATQAATLETIEKAYKAIFPFAFESSHVEDGYANQYVSYFDFSILIKAFALLAILMAGIGLLGLASNETAKRTKEVAIRKINGAQVQDIYILFLKYFFRLIGISFVLSLPVSFYFAKDWLNNFAVKIEIGVWFVWVPVLVSIVIGLLSIGYSLIKSTLQNPITILRNNK